MMFTQLYVPSFAVCKKVDQIHFPEKDHFDKKQYWHSGFFQQREVNYWVYRLQTVWSEEKSGIYLPFTNSYFALKNQKGTNFHQSLHKNTQYVNVITFVQTYYTYTQLREIGNWTTNNASKTSRFARQRRKLDCRCPF